MNNTNDVSKMERSRTANYGMDIEDVPEIPCPICGSISFDFVLCDKEGDIVGCEECLRRIYYEELAERFKERRGYNE